MRRLIGKREVNKKVLKVPSIEPKVLDATSNEPWGPHGSHLADIAQATRNYHEYQMIMSVLWKRINDTGKNWRHVYKITNMSAMMPSQSLLPRMQFGISGGNRTLASQNLSDQMFNMGAVNPGTMMPIQQQQQQQHGSQGGAFGNMGVQNAQNLQAGLVPLQQQNTPQNHPNFKQQRQQNQQ